MHSLCMNVNGGGLYEKIKKTVLKMLRHQAKRGTQELEGLKFRW